MLGENLEDATKSQENDGGYYAIKGFLYQFDKCLIEIMSNPSAVVEIENIQDINYEKYVLQIKLKESATYYNSLLRTPIKQLLNLFEKDRSKFFILYCHFNNKSPESKKISVLELDNILGDDSTVFSDELKSDFIGNFLLEFSENYLNQFENLIELIANRFKCPERELALIYHSIIHSNLMKIAILSNKADRRVSFYDLEKYLDHVDKRIFYNEYEHYLSKERYNKLIKKQFFTFTSANIDNFERLFILEVTNGTTQTDLLQIVNRITQRYYKLFKSPAPYLFLLDIENDFFIELKRCLRDREIPFVDGTTFNGDKFRLNALLVSSTREREIKLKIISSDDLAEVLLHLRFDEIFYFASKFDDSYNSLQASSNLLKIQIAETKQILNLL